MMAGRRGDGLAPRLLMLLLPLLWRVRAAHIKKAEAAASSGVAAAARDGLEAASAMRYLNDAELGASLRSLAEEEAPGGLARLFSIGRSGEGRELWVLRLSAGLPEPEAGHAGADPGGPPIPGRPQVKLVANMHGDETLGRALLVRLGRELVSGWLRGDARAHRLLSSTDLYLMPSLNPDGFARAREGNCDNAEDQAGAGDNGRTNAKGRDLNRSFPDQFGGTPLDLAAVPEVRALMEWMRRNR